MYNRRNGKAKQKEKLLQLHGRFAALSEKIKTELDPPDLPELKTYQVVQLLLWKLEMWKADLAAGSQEHTVEWGERVLAVLHRVYDKIMELAWAKTDDEVFAAVKDDLKSINLSTIFGGEYSDGRPYWEGDVVESRR
ncbi:hypothetical protein MFIFM68171_06362 [Madurella fahalii]|uniref:Uncharacterized protein n=1 Tax=Madurella fahalii TaxID=1157608 RepID=A0ABQ0GEI7_9PEZI